MGKVVVYLRERDEAELRAKGHDPAEWVRRLVRRELPLLSVEKKKRRDEPRLL
jgi:hypothetical protein